VLHAGSGLMQGSMGIYGARMLDIPMVVMSGEALTYGTRMFRSWIAVVPVSQRGRRPQTYAAHLTKWPPRRPAAATLYEMVIRAGEMAQRPQKGTRLFETSPSRL